MKRIKLSKWQLFNHFSIPLIVTILPLVFYGYTYWEIEISNTYSGVRTLQELSFINYFSIIGIIGFIIKYKRLYFKEIIGNINEDTLKTTLSRLKKEYSLIIIRKSKNHYTYKMSNVISYNKRIEIIKEDNRILFNEICFPEFGLNRFVLGIRKKELKNFIRHLNDVRKGKKYSTEKHFTDNQWSVKMILIRLFLYPLSIFLIGFSILHLYKNDFITAFIISIISISYLISDIYMVLKKKAVNKT